MKNLICVKCGGPAIRNNLCRRHFIEKERLFDIRDFSLTACRNCGSCYDGEWKKARSVEEAAVSIARRRLPAGLKAHIDANKKGNMIILRIVAEGRIAGIKKREEKAAKVSVNKKLCENCIKLSGGYYEALIQIRGGKAEEIAEKARDVIDTSLVVNAAEAASGYDIKLLTKSAARKVVRALEDYQIKKSYKHVTAKQGKRVCRDCYSVR